MKSGFLIIDAEHYKMRNTCNGIKIGRQNKVSDHDLYCTVKDTRTFMLLLVFFFQRLHKWISRVKDPRYK